MKFNNLNVSIHPTAKVMAGARIGDNTVIGENVVVHSGAIIGNNCVVGEPTVDYYSDHDFYVNAPTIIGRDSLIRSHAIVYAGSVLGNDFSCGHRVTIRENCIFGEGVRIGTNSDIMNNVSIGNNSWLHSGVFLPANSVIGNYVMLYPHVVFTDDSYPPSNICSAPVVNDYAQVGAQSIILPGVSIGFHALIAAGSVVTKSVPDFRCVRGNPARDAKDVRNIRLDDGSSAYPWPYRFNRGMPWDDSYDEWLRNSSESAN